MRFLPARIVTKGKALFQGWWMPWLVWALWAGLLGVIISCFFAFPHNIPLAEDWLLVPALTGHESDLLQWLWEQNNEHRIPLPKIILLTLLKLTGGDFRSGMIFNIVTIGATSAAMILVARQVRGGRLRMTDAFFPLVLLHLGHWDNLLWGWQVTQVLPTLIACVVLLLLVRFRDISRPAVAWGIGLCLVLLPLCGANGFVFVPLPVLWFGYVGLVQLRQGSRQGLKMMSLAALSLALCAVYFVGYERPDWLLPNPGPMLSLAVAFQFLSFGLGPGVQIAWGPFVAFSLALVLFCTFVAVRASWTSPKPERRRAIGVLLFLVNMGGFVLAMGWSRAGALDVFGYWPLRYALMAAPAFCTIYFVFELYAVSRARALVQWSLLAASILLLPYNVRYGWYWGKWYQEESAALEQSLDAGAAPVTIAERHGAFLIHWWNPSQLVPAMRMLYDAGIGPFTRLNVAATSPSEEDTAEASLPEVTQDGRPLVDLTFAYRLADAGTVWLVWGLDGWQPLAESLRPPGTHIERRVMRTLMASHEGAFRARTAVPVGSVVEYGFLTTHRRDSLEIQGVWDGREDYRIVAHHDSTVVVEAGTMLQSTRSKSVWPWVLGVLGGLVALLWFVRKRSA